MQQAARKRTQEYLEALQRASDNATIVGYEEAIRRSDLAKSFIQHPYWDLVSRMLTGTIKVSTEELLASDEHKDMNRASVAMCRKTLQMPFLDIEQGRMAEAEFERAKASIAMRRSSPKQHTLHEVQ